MIKKKKTIIHSALTCDQGTINKMKWNKPTETRKNEWKIKEKEKRCKIMKNQKIWLIL